MAPIPSRPLSDPSVPSPPDRKDLHSRPTRPISLSLPLLLSGFILFLAFIWSIPLPPYTTSSHLSQLGIASDGISNGAPFAKNERVLILTAHPDDEVMFFGPVILGLKRMGVSVRGLCLSTGNGDGLGEIRTEELFESYKHLGIHETLVTLIDHPQLQDGMQNTWDIDILNEVIGDYLIEYPVDSVITFDRKGITHHPNHIQLSLPFFSNTDSSSSGSLSERLPHPPKLYTLHTVPIYIKFTGPIYIVWKKLELGMSWLRSWAQDSLDMQYLELWKLLIRSWNELSSFLSSSSSKSPTDSITTSIMFHSTLPQYIQTLTAMRKHTSQMVWFRWGYVGLSKYMWSGEIRRVG